MTTSTAVLVYLRSETWIHVVVFVFRINNPYMSAGRLYLIFQHRINVECRRRRRRRRRLLLLY